MRPLGFLLFGFFERSDTIAREQMEKGSRNIPSKMRSLLRGCPGKPVSCPCGKINKWRRRLGTQTRILPITQKAHVALNNFWRFEKKLREKITPTIPNLNFSLNEFDIQIISTRHQFFCQTLKKHRAHFEPFCDFRRAYFEPFLKNHATSETPGFAWSCHECASTFPLCSFSQKCAHREKKWIMFWRKNKSVFQKSVHVELLHLLFFF